MQTHRLLPGSPANNPVSGNPLIASQRGFTKAAGIGAYGAVATAPDCIAPPANMVAWYPADTTANDIQSGNAGTLNGAATIDTAVAGRVGRGAFKFLGGVNDYASSPDSASLNIGTGDFSIDAWIQINAADKSHPGLNPNVRSIQDKRVNINTGTIRGYHFYLKNGFLGLQISNGAGQSGFEETTVDVADGNFHHVAATVVRTSATGGHLYVDGVSVLTFNPTGRTGSLSNPAEFLIGGHLADSANNFIGFIDELEVFTRALTAAEVLALSDASAAGVGKCYADLAITMTDSMTTLTPGGSVTYTITASNLGHSNITVATVADTFPASLTCTWACVGADGGACTASGSGNINDTVNLPLSGTVTYTASCTISPSLLGPLSNTATVTTPGDVNSGNDSATDNLVINCQTITVTNPATTAGTMFSPFSQTFTQSGGIGTTTFSTASTLPTSLTLSSAGVLSGTPTQTGSFPITVKATDSNGCMGTGATYNLIINPVPCITSLTVNDLGDGADATPGNGICATGGGVCSLRAAIMEANALTNCTPLTINFSVTGVINLAMALPDLDHPNLTINGPGANQLDVHRNVAGNFRIFVISNDRIVNLAGLTLSNGDVGGDTGGGIRNLGTLKITNCAITGNHANGGGGIDNYDTLTMTGSTLSGNSANFDGGGLYHFASNGTSGNATATLTNCTISGNSGGAGFSSAISIIGDNGVTALVTLTNCTVTANTGGASAIASFNVGAATAVTTQLKNTLVAGNSGANFDIPANTTLTSQGNNLDSDGTSGFTNGVNGDVVGTVGTPINALLAPLGNYGGPTPTHALLPGSPAINAGNNCVLTNSCASNNLGFNLTTDQRGIARPQQTTVDIGAFESQGFSLMAASGTPQSAIVNTNFSTPLKVTVTANGSEPVNGGLIAFIPPGSGASASVAGNLATIASGMATSGTVTANSVTGNYSVSASANGASLTNFALTNTCQTIIVTNPATTTCTANAAFSQTFTQTGGIGTTRFSTASTLPMGLTLASNGTLSGTPTQTGTFPILVKATDSNGCMGTGTTYNLVINCQTITVMNPATTTGTAFSSFSQTFTQTGGIGTTTFSTASTLPTGLTLSSAGVLSGTPTQTGTFPIVVKATDSNGCMGTGGTYNLVINAVPCITSLTVNDLGDGADATPGNGVCATSGGVCTLRAAIMEANALTNCTPLTINFSVSGVINLATTLPNLDHHNLTITGPSADQLTVRRNAAGLFRIFQVNVGKIVNLAGLTITNGDVGSVSDGGAILNSGTLTITNCTVTGSHANGGGGIYNASTLIMTGSTLSGNSANFDGGGLYNTDPGNANLTNCTISGNQAGSLGAGVGGILNVSFSVASSTLQLTNCTIANNTSLAAGNSGGIKTVNNPATTSLRNTIIANNTTANLSVLGGGAVISLGNNLASESGGGFLNAAGDLINTNPLLSALGNYGGPTPTHALLPGSPAIDKGAAASGVATDQRGQARPFDIPSIANAAGGNASDIGAFEVQCAAISLAGLPGGAAGVAYTPSNVASGGTAPYTLSVTGGALPPGITINGNGLAGTPTQTGTFSFTLLASDAYGCQNSQNYTVTIVCPVVSLLPTALPNATVNTAYSTTITASPAGGNYSFAVTGGLLPAGLTLNSNGTFSGAPTQGGLFNFRITAIGFGGCPGFRDYQLIVDCTAITLSPASLPGGTIGTSYSQSVAATPGNGYSFAVTLGSLPAGLTLNAATGAITGTPAANGSYNFRITASAGACSGTQQFTIEVGCATITLPALANATAGIAYSQSAAATPAGTYTYSLSQGNLPSGLSLNPQTGLLSGMPSVTGTYNFTIKAQSASGCSGTRTYAFVINCPTVAINPANLPPGSLGASYNQTLSAAPAGGNYTYAVSGTLPSGLSLNPATGVLGGTPTANGTFNFTITAMGFGGCTGSKAYSITVGGGCPAITLPDLPSGTVGQMYNQSLTASPAGSYSYLQTGAMPPGLTFYATGLLFGYPSATGTYNFTVTATGSNNCTGSKSYSLVIGGAGLARAVFGDFDGDGKTDFSVWRGQQSDWLTVRSSDSKLQTAQWGAEYDPYNDVIVPGDFDGDGKFDVAVFRRATGQWLIKCSKDGSVMTEAWGLASDTPVAADYDGDGKADIAVWRGAETRWYILRSSDHQTQIVSWGSSSAPYRDVPVPADYDGDGKTDIAVFRQSNGHWYIKQSSDGQVIDKAWGLGTDVPVPADYDGDGKADIAVWRGQASTWYIIHSSSGLLQTVNWGASYAPYNDVPVPGDYDGDGKADIAIWRPLNGEWYVIRSSDGGFLIQAHGQAGDRPVPSLGAR
jgi:uncharacterized repeat protein (TIGR01451 family)/CSLREA domain-containing protein